MVSETDQRAMANKIGKLPTLPGVAIKILQAMRKETPSIMEIANIISTDAPLSAKVLQVVNSPFYGLAIKISSVSQAMIYLGLNTVKNLALSFSLMLHFRGKKQCALNYVQFWKDSLVGAVTAKLIVERISRGQGENAFFLGLLQDIGVLILADSFPELYQTVCQKTSSEGSALHEVEDELLGTNHMVVGEYVTSQWGLPLVFSVPIGAHHVPERLETAIEDVRLMTQVLNLSSLFIELFKGVGPPRVCGRIDHTLQALKQLPGLNRGQLAQNIVDNIRNILPIFEIEIDEAKYIEIIEVARNELSKLSRDLLDQVQSQGKDLDQLKLKVNKDSLTGLDNRESLVENLQREISRASRYKTALSVAMADLDHFKSINDFFGHLAGDHVLKSVSVRLKQELRDSDMIARYGGEEFFIIMPMTTLDEACIAVERIRKAIAGMQIEFGGKPISVTSSFGVAALGSQSLEVDAFIKMADEALYEAKRTGRNCFCKFKPIEPKHSSPSSVVVIDDEEVVLITVTKMLQRLGYSVVALTSGQEAIKHLRSKPKVALVIMDVVMPDINPEQLVEVIHGMKFGTKVLLTSGYSQTTVCNSGLFGKVDGFLQKPFNLSELAEIVTKSLGSAGYHPNQESRL
jgi:two-component system, cell cycle response regulator